MKKIVYTIALLLSIGVGNNINAQNKTTYKVSGKVIEVVKTSATSNNKDIKTEYVVKDTDGKTYPVYLHKYVAGNNAGKYGIYIVKTSAKTGKEYKKYLTDPELLKVVLSTSKISNK